MGDDQAWFLFLLFYIQVGRYMIYLHYVERKGLVVILIVHMKIFLLFFILPIWHWKFPLSQWSKQRMQHCTLGIFILYHCIKYKYLLRNSAPLDGIISVTLRMQSKRKHLVTYIRVGRYLQYISSLSYI